MTKGTSARTDSSKFVARLFKNVTWPKRILHYTFCQDHLALIENFRVTIPKNWQQ
jgi:hypothetical protein